MATQPESLHANHHRWPFLLLILALVAIGIVVSRCLPSMLSPDPVTPTPTLAVVIVDPSPRTVAPITPTGTATPMPERILATPTSTPRPPTETPTAIPTDTPEPTRKPPDEMRQRG